MTRDIFQAEHVNPPELGKPSGFSHAVRVTGGTTVYLAGQTALDAEGRSSAQAWWSSSSRRWATC